MASLQGVGFTFRMMRKFGKGDGIGRRLRLSCREIALALALTVAAMVAVLTAVHTQAPGKLGKPVATTEKLKND